jgi:integrase
MTISFYQRGSTIYCRVHHGSNMIRVSTGIKSPHYVKFAKDKFIGDTSEVASLNADLSRQKTIINELYAHYNGDLLKVREGYMAPELRVDYEEADYDLVNLCQRYLSNIMSGEIKTRQKKEFRESSYRTYSFPIRVLSQFAATNGSINLNDFVLDGKGLKEKQNITEKFVAYFEKLTNYMIDCGHQINTRRECINILCIITNYYREKLFLNIPKIPRLNGHETPIIVLQPEFLKKFVMDEHNYYKEFTPSAKYLWEVIATMLVTSFRISDAVLLTKNDFTIKNSEVFLIKENQKTGENTEMPLPRVLTDIYMENLARHQSIFTPIDTPDKAQYIRRKIKNLFCMYPEMHEMVTVKKADVRGNKIAVTKKMYEWVHPHMLRKTAITTMLVNNVSPDHVKFASGHRPNSEAFNRYVGFVDRHYKSQITDYHKKMFS